MGYPKFKKNHIERGLFVDNSWKGFNFHERGSINADFQYGTQLRLFSILRHYVARRERCDVLQQSRSRIQVFQSLFRFPM